MPLAATHIITTTSLIGRFFPKNADNHAFSKRLVFWAAFASLLPDIDIPLGWTLRSLGFVFEHGTVTHTPLFALIILFIAVMFTALQKKHASQVFIVFFIGSTIHLILDYTLGGGAKEGIAWFYPFSSETYKIHLLFLLPFNNVPEALDAIVLMVFFYINSYALLQISKQRPLTKNK